MQVGAEDHAAQAGKGIALGFCSGKHLRHGAGVAGCLIQPVVQALVSRVVGTPIRLGHGTEAGQYRALTEGAVSNAACGQLTAEEKASVSHRGKALRAFAAALDDYLKGNE